MLISPMGWKFDNHNILINGFFKLAYGCIVVFGFRNPLLQVIGDQDDDMPLQLRVVYRFRNLSQGLEKRWLTSVI
jgi:hypothetical protein